MNPRLVLVLVLASAACAGERTDRLEARVDSVAADAERLSRELDALRKQGGGAGTTAGPDLSQRLRETNATVDALVDHLTRTGPHSIAAAALLGLWQARAVDAPSNSDRPDLVETLHFAPDGRLCGYRVRASAPASKEPFWGTWRLRAGLLIELRDRWVGDHNEVDGRVREVLELKADSATLRGRGTLAFTRLPSAEWEKATSLYEDRLERIPGLPSWCFKPAANPQ